MAINNTGSRRLLVTLTALFAALCGLYLLIGGGWLVAIGGSWYYPIAGLVMLGVAWMLWRSKRAALWLYAALLLGTMIWGVWEVGFDFWALTPRSDILVFFGIWLILPFVWRRLVIPASGAVAALVVALLISGSILTWAGFNDPQEINGTLSADATPAEAISPVADQDWPAYGRNQEGQRFSPLKQINADNVHNLKEAWVFRTGDVKQPNDPGEITNEVTPIKVGDTLYLCTAHQRLFALDAASGKEKWHYDPELKTNESFQHVTCRGVSYHEAKAETASPEVMADCPRRIILPVNDGRLIAINAENGKLCETFANKGVLNLQSNMPDTKPGLYEPTSPPIITDKTIVMAGSVTDNFSTRETSGVIRGFDVNTGELLWAFDPGAKDPNAIPSDEHTFTFNSPNSWAPAAYDAKLDLVYLPMGVTTPDIWGGNRTPEQERYASSILALNATTGKLAWSYDDPRFKLVIDDGVNFVNQTSQTFDVIISDCTDPIGPGESLFTSAFYEGCKRCLNPGGIFVAQNGVCFLQQEEAIDSHRKLSHYFSDVGFYQAAIPTYYGGIMTFAWATDNDALRHLSTEIIQARFLASGLKCRYYNPAIHTAAFALPQYLQDALASQPS